MDTLIHRRVQLCRDGQFEQAVCRVSSGWVVMGDVQLLQGYCLLLPDPVVPNLNGLKGQKRKDFLYEMSVIGDVLLELTDAIRINYEMIGNVEPALHAHLFPRYADEPGELRLKPVWFYDWSVAQGFNLEQQTPFMNKLRAGLSDQGLLLKDQ